MKIQLALPLCLHFLFFGIAFAHFGCSPYDSNLSEQQAQNGDGKNPGSGPTNPPPGPPPPPPPPVCEGVGNIDEFTRIKVFPEQVGVFTSVGKQQFVAIGYKNGGSAYNLTKCVDWASSDGQVASIDTMGLATIKSTFGRIEISAKVKSLSNKTSLTVVNVTERRYGKSPTSVDVTKWTSWPDTNNNNHLKLTTPEIAGRLYLYDVVYQPKVMNWKSLPHLSPYPDFPNGLNGMICAVWSEDGGRNFILQSWDYVADYSHGKGIEKGMPAQWMGAMVHTLCDFKAGECNGRSRSNLYFSQFPTP